MYWSKQSGVWGDDGERVVSMTVPSPPIIRLLNFFTDAYRHGVMATMNTNALGGKRGVQATATCPPAHDNQIRGPKGKGKKR